jgi:hypothetical protein
MLPVRWCHAIAYPNTARRATVSPLWHPGGVLGRRLPQRRLRGMRRFFLFFSSTSLTQEKERREITAVQNTSIAKRMETTLLSSASSH